MLKKWWPERGSESLWSFRICNLHILNGDENAESARIPGCAFNLLANFGSGSVIVPFLVSENLESKFVFDVKNGLRVWSEVKVLMAANKLKTQGKHHRSPARKRNALPPILLGFAGAS